MSEFWQNKIKAFLHDPPDKALILFHKSHERKRDEILSKLGLNYDKGIDTADHIASAMQRLDIPKECRMDDARNCDSHICFKGAVKPVFKHTLSGEEKEFKEIIAFIADYDYEGALKKYGFNSNVVEKFLDKNNWKKTYFLLWRFLPEEYNLGFFLPADTRIPDHSIWDHLNVTTAINSCLGDLGLFALKIPAVQEFILHSRKLSDLWASSHIFSTIIFEGIKVIVDNFGSDIVIYPQLRGTPMVDIAEFNEEGGKFKLLDEGIKLSLIKKENNKERLQIANFPNTFLCFIPVSKAEEISKKVKEKIREKWKRITDEAKDLLNRNGIKIDEELWNKQIENTIEIASAWIKFFNLDKFNNIKNDVPKDLRETQEKWLSFVEAEKNYGHFYLITYDLLGVILTQKSRLWNAWEEEIVTDKKCLMCGRRNAVVERREGNIYQYWDNAWKTIEVKDEKWRSILKEGERLCAVCLIKRIYRELFKKEFSASPPEFESVVEIAGRSFIKNVENDEDFKLLKDIDIELIYKHEWKSEEKKNTTIKQLESIKKKEEIENKLEKWRNIFGEPSKYYAILMMDGDRIGKALSGEILPIFGEFFHPAFKSKILNSETFMQKESLIKIKRILSPSHHIAISRAMKDFSLYKVPEIVKKYEGLLVYAGGDDVLALLPVDKVLEAAKDIQEYFKKDFYEIDINGERKELMGLGNKVTMSAGIVFAHYKWPLYDAIENVRKAEKKAKNNYGRNAFCITIIKRSGKILSAGGKWDFVGDLIYIVKSIVNRKVSHGFIYDFINAIEILEGDMLKAEAKRLLNRRREKATKDEIKEIEGKLLCLIEKYSAQDLQVKEIGNALKILYNVYKSEEL